MNTTRLVPALRFRSLTRFYDPLIRLTVRESTFREMLLNQASLRAGQRILDLGCGTGSFLLLVKNRFPTVKAVGLDADPEILEIAREKLGPNHFELTLGSADALPYGDSSLDIVFSSLMFHHLVPNKKRGAFREVFRVLRPSGELHIADWGKPANVLLAFIFGILRVIDGLENTRENVRGLLPHLMKESGFVEVMQTGKLNTIFGTMVLLRGKKTEGR